MGTNFYFTDDNGIEKHIGKRSAAGEFCWDCGISLCAAGHNHIHKGHTRFLESCPVCGQSAQEETLNNSTAGRELGFNKSIPKTKTGVRSCASFSWAMSPEKFADLIEASNLHIVNEYGDVYTRNEFSSVLSECPVKFFHKIGEEFS